MSVRVKRFLDSPSVTRAMQIAAAVSLIVAIVVGVKQYSLASCLASYSDASARSTAARSAAAAEDRRADESDRQANEDDRVAFRQLIDALASQDQAKSRTTFINLVATYKRTDEARAATAKARVETEKKRQQNPVPPPPSLKCA